MRDIALNTDTHDLQITDFDLSFIENVDQIAQNLNIRLRFFRGEWYLNTLVGIPYYQYFFIKNPNQIQVDSFIKNEIYDTEGVTTINDYSSAFDAVTRNYSVNFNCSALDSDITIEASLP